MADNPTPELPDFSSPTDAAGHYWYVPGDWVEAPPELYVDGKAIRWASGIWVAPGEQWLAAPVQNGKRPTRRQRIDALVRRVLRRKAGA